MAADSEAYKGLIDYIEKQIVEGKITIGDRLPSERELAAMLGISRGAVRIGLNVLEAIGVVNNRPGSGNYIAGQFDHNLVQLMTIMYTLDDMSTRDICGFRYAAELQAIMRAPQNITYTHRRLLGSYLGIMLSSENPDERSYGDNMIHRTIVEASGNRLLIANYLALNGLMEKFVRHVREGVLESEPQEYERFQQTHARLVEAVCNKNYEKAKEALDEHQAFLERYIDD